MKVGAPNFQYVFPAIMLTKSKWDLVSNILSIVKFIVFAIRELKRMYCCLQHVNGLCFKKYTVKIS